MIHSTRQTIRMRLLIVFLICLASFVLGAAQTQGFEDTIRLPGVNYMDIDDIVYHDDHLYIQGSVYNPSIERWCIYIACLDTTGNLLWHREYCDTLTFDHLAVNSPSRFAFSPDGEQIVLPFSYFSQRDLGWLILDTMGIVTYQGKYVNNEKTIYPIDIAFQD